MGILSGGGEGKGLQKLGRFLHRWSTFLSALFYICGIVYASVIIWPSFSLGTYFSENALLPAIVDEKFDDSSSLARVRNEFKMAFKKTKDDNNTLSDKPIEWLMSVLKSHGLEVFAQEFSVQKPFSDVIQRGTNVYGIVRAARGAPLEAIVVGARLQNGLYAPAAVITNFAQFCQKQIYWAKDIIFVFADLGEVGMQAWLSAYHGRHMQNVQYAPLYGRGGAIQAAVLLDSDRFSGPVTHVDIKYNMLNGKLPNLDLVNVVIKLTEKQALKPTVHGQEGSGSGYNHYYAHDSYNMKGYMGFARTGLLSVLSQGGSRLDGLHSVFGSFAIEAVTLHAQQKTKDKANNDPAAYTLNSITRILEGTLRSLNNLLERLHQSYFFYVLLSPHKFVSIGLYIPAVILIAIAPVLKGVSLWLSLNAEIDKSEDSETKKRHVVGYDYSLLSSLPFVLQSYMFGALLLYYPSFMNSYVLRGAKQSAQGQQLLFAATVALIGAMFLLPVMLARSLCRCARIPSSAALRCVLLIHFGLFLGVTSLLNFGLAFIVAVVSTPFLLFIRPFNNRFVQYLSSFVCFCLNPLCVLVLYSIAMTAVQVPPDAQAAYHLLQDVYHVAQDILMRLVFESYLFESATLSWICLGLVPLWTLFWVVAQQPACTYKTKLD